MTFTSSQSIVNLESSAETQKFFDFIIRYSMALTSFSRFNIDSGYRWQDGAGVGLDDIASGCGYELNLGKFLMNIRYDFKRQLYLGDKWVNHFFSMRVKRSF